MLLGTGLGKVPVKKLKYKQVVRQQAVLTSKATSGQPLSAKQTNRLSKLTTELAARNAGRAAVAAIQRPATTTFTPDPGTTGTGTTGGGNTTTGGGSGGGGSTGGGGGGAPDFSQYATGVDPYGQTASGAFTPTTSGGSAAAPAESGSGTASPPVDFASEQPMTGGLSGKAGLIVAAGIGAYMLFFRKKGPRVSGRSLVR